MSDTRLWSIEPRDTLVLGDGRPVSAGAPMRSLNLPWPSTLAGLFRTLVGGFSKSGEFALSKEDALAIEVAGPWLVREHNGTSELMVEAPSDVVWFAGTASRSAIPLRVRLVPTPVPPNVFTDLPAGLELVVMDPSAESHPEDKPDRSAPRFWLWSAFESWLTAPCSGQVAFAKVGVAELVHEVRRHVSMNPETATAADSQLFAVDQVRYVSRDGAQFSLLARCDRLTLKDDRLVTLGGERRPSYLRSSSLRLPQVPRAVIEHPGRLRLILMTPGIFAEGYRPRELPGAKLVAAAVGRSQFVSGWDYSRGGPKPSRRMAPAGSVYWVDLEPGVDRKAWIQRFWMQSIADDEQDRRDGFGIVAIGVG